MSRNWNFWQFLAVFVAVLALLSPGPAVAGSPPGADLVAVDFSDEWGVMALSRFELFRSADGKAWQALGLSGKGESFTAITSCETVILLATESGNILRSTDGRNFQAVPPPKDPYGRAVQGIRTLAISPKGKDALASNGQGLVRSQDGGLTWKPVEAPFYKVPEARQVILAAFAKADPVIVTRTGAYHEAKGGFEPFTKGLPEKAQPTVAAVFEGEILMAIPEKGIFQAVKDSSWKALQGAPGDPVAFVGFASKGYLAARVASPLHLGDPKGKGWKPVGTTVSANFTPRDSAATPFGDFVLFRGKGLMRLDGEALSPVELPAALSAVRCALKLPSGQLAGTQGGIFFSSDGSTWRDVTPAELGAPANVLLRTASGLLLLGTEGGGVFASEDGGMSWRLWDRGLGTANTIRGLAEYGGGILAGTENGLMWTALGTDPDWGFRPGGLGRFPVLDMAVRGDNVWIATQNGVLMARTGGDFAPLAGFEGVASSVDADGTRVAALVDGQVRFSEGGSAGQTAPPLGDNGRAAGVAILRGAVHAGTSKGVFRLEAGSWSRASESPLPVEGLIPAEEGLRVVTAGGGTYVLP